MKRLICSFGRNATMSYDYAMQCVDVCIAILQKLKVTQTIKIKIETDTLFSQSLPERQQANRGK